jgi:hypothetical protein
LKFVLGKLTKHFFISLPDLGIAKTTENLHIRFSSSTAELKTKEANQLRCFGVISS